jgi:vitamin B12 transporter
MARGCAAGLTAWLVFQGGIARAEPDGGVLLPPVVVPLPPAEPAPETPSRRDPTGVVTRVEASAHAGEAKDAAELLATSPGVLVQQNGGVGQLKTLSLRGVSPSGVLVFLDGVPLNGAGGEVDLSAIPAALIERMEVLRGAAGARYGSGGLGGAVNIITRQPTDGAHVAAEASYGSFGTESGQAGGTGELLGGEGLVLAHVLHSDGDFPYAYNPTPQLTWAPLVAATRQNNDAALGGGLLAWRRALGSNMVGAMVEASELARGLAGPNENPTPDAREQDGRLLATVHAVHPGERSEVSARAWFRDDGTRLTGGVFGSGIRQTEVAGGGEAQATYLWHNNDLALDLSGSRETLAVVGGAHPARTVGSAMASDEILLHGGDVSIVPSVRVDQAGPFYGISPKLGASAVLPAGITVKANAGQAFRAPSFLELYVAQGSLLPNPLLQPERALFVDGQVSHETRFSSLALGAFYALYENLIAYEYYPPLFAKPYNFDAALVEGLEAEGELHPRPWLGGSFAYTLTFTQNLRDDPRYYLKELPYRPRHRLYARAAVGPAWARGQLDVDYQSSQFTNRTEAVSLPGRAFVGAGVSSELWRVPKVVLAVQLKNAFDAQAEDFDGYPLPGRAIYATLSVSWDRAPEARTLSPSASPAMLTSR